MNIGNITDDSRIRASLDTIKYITDRDGKIIPAKPITKPQQKNMTKV